MKLKLRMSVVDIIDMIQRFLIAYCIITIALYHIDNSAALYNLGLFPIPFLSYLIQKNSKHIWSFILLHCCILPFYVFTTFHPVAVTVFSFYIILTAIISFISKHHSFVRFNIYLIAVFVLLYLILSGLKITYLAQFTLSLTILYTLLSIFNLYLQNLDKYFHSHATITNIPYQQIKSSNNILMLFLGGLFLIVMLVSYGLPLTNLLSRIGKFILRIILSPLRLLTGNETEPEETLEEETEQTLPLDTESSELLQFIFKIIEWLFILLVAVALIALFTYSVYKLYQYFYRKRVNDSMDRIEYLSPFIKKEATKKTPRKFGFHLFGRSNNAVIRKHFFKAVSSSADASKKLQKNLTPTEITELMKLGGKGTDPAIMAEQRKLITAYYEKARYSNEECSKEEVKKIKEMLK
ncbi:hypothetical protein I5677_01715 [Mobilitalea sibirica]|uniref:DUF4129 domain-containing protein n=1 Tax=Mobilitalea sibirica TaxID=1462919 RepID=A0A8J7L1Y7_9FIRM|nr:hypothetical protein [Mobilitalea sibirica]MBH1939608.1 hypothetical protein [Mobilitalea sibirica]